MPKFTDAFMRRFVVNTSKKENPRTERDSNPKTLCLNVKDLAGTEVGTKLKSHAVTIKLKVAKISPYPKIRIQPSPMELTPACRLGTSKQRPAGPVRPSSWFLQVTDKLSPSAVSRGRRWLQSSTFTWRNVNIKAPYVLPTLSYCQRYVSQHLEDNWRRGERKSHTFTCN